MNRGSQRRERGRRIERMSQRPASIRVSIECRIDFGGSGVTRIESRVKKEEKPTPLSGMREKPWERRRRETGKKLGRQKNNSCCDCLGKYLPPSSWI